MGFVKPPMMTGDNSRDIANLRDYLFRMAKSLDPVIAATDSTELSVSYQGGRPVTKAAMPMRGPEERGGTQEPDHQDGK